MAKRERKTVLAPRPSARPRNYFTPFIFAFVAALLAAAWRLSVDTRLWKTPQLKLGLPALQLMLQGTAGGVMGPIDCHRASKVEEWKHPHPSAASLLQGQSTAYNESMLWGTYRPSVYYGFKSRTAPAYVGGGLLWHGDSRGTAGGRGGGGGNVKWKHDAREGEGVIRFGWLEHDGRAYGRQTIVDADNDVELNTIMVKPREIKTTKSEESSAAVDNIAMITRVEVSSPTSVYMYFGVDCDGTVQSAEPGACMRMAGSGPPKRSGAMRVERKENDLHVSVGTAQLGELMLKVLPSKARGAKELHSELKVHYVGLADVMFADVEDALKALQRQAERDFFQQQQQQRKAQQQGGAAGESVAERSFSFQLADEIAPGSNVVVVQITGAVPFTVDFVLLDDGSGGGGGGGDGSGGSGGSGAKTAGMNAAVTPPDISDWIVAAQSAYTTRFNDVFKLQQRGFSTVHVAAAKFALGNMLGGMGYFYGRSKLVGTNGDESFPVALFTAVPSRSFFPRGFLWDEGFHQLLVKHWDVDITQDVLAHWLGTMHTNAAAAPGTAAKGNPRGNGSDESKAVSRDEEADRDAQPSCPGGWIPREQILGEVSRRRVPSEFMAQNPKVANPPSLLLLVERLMDMHEPELAAKAASIGGGVSVGVGGGLGQWEQSEAASGLGSSSLSSVGAFLQRIAPALDQWLQWLIFTQQPGGGISGTGGAGKQGNYEGMVSGGGGDDDTDHDEGSDDDEAARRLKTDEKTFFQGLKGRAGGLQWQGRDPSEDKLNPMTLASGLDDYPRAALPTDEECHVDLLCWAILGCRVMGRLQRTFGHLSNSTTAMDAAAGAASAGVFTTREDEKGGAGGSGGKSDGGGSGEVEGDGVGEGRAAGPDVFGAFPDYARIAVELEGVLDELHWSDRHEAYLDVGREYDSGKVVQEVTLRCASDPRGRGGTKDVGVPLREAAEAGGDRDEWAKYCPPDFPFPMQALGDGRGNTVTRDRWYGDGQPSVQHVHHIGYVSLFPLLLKLIKPDDPKLLKLLEDMTDPAQLWSPYGLRSLSKADEGYYHRGNNPGDEPYWRGYIWLNMNYLACGALYHYAHACTGLVQQKMGEAYIQLRTNLLRTVLGEYERTGFLWEQYDDGTGEGRRSHPFTGWTALVVNIMAELY